MGEGVPIDFCFKISTDNLLGQFFTLTEDIQCFVYLLAVV